MKNNRIPHYTLYAIGLFLLDFALTVFILSNNQIVTEANPLFYSHFGYVTLFINVLYLISIYLMTLCIKHYQTVMYDEKSSLAYFFKLYRSHHSLFIVVSVFSAYIKSTLVARMFVVVEWLTFGIFEEAFLNSVYFTIRERFPLERFDVVFGLVLFVYFWLDWYRKEHLKAKDLVRKSKAKESI